MPFSGPLGGQYATLVGIVTAIAFDPLAHGRARRRHDRNRQNTTCRELQSFMRFWRVTEADNYGRQPRRRAERAAAGCPIGNAAVTSPYSWNPPTPTCPAGT